ncbi:MAG: V-type ATP synthase subunit I [Chloroflexota bacterium]
MGAIVNSPETMVRMRVVTSRDRTSQALNVLQRAGVLHAEESTELQPVDREAIEKERRRVSELLTNIQDALNYVSLDEMVKIHQDADVYLTKPLEEIGDETTRLCTKLGAMHERAEKLQKEKEDLEEVRLAVSILAQRLDLTTADLDFTGQHLFSRLVALPREVYQAVGTQLQELSLSHEAVEAEDWTYVHVISKTANKEAVDGFVTDNSGRYLQVPGASVPLKDFASKADEETARIQSELDGIRAEITARTSENLESLVLLREALFAENERLAVLEKACEARYVTLIEGWVPESAVQTATGDLKEEVSYVYIETREVKRDEEPPTKMRNPKALRPFEVVVNLFGTPKYREWDPTPIIAYSFAFFYGVMLGDAVYGILLIVLTRFTLPKLVDDPQTEGFVLFRTLLYISAGVAVLMGVLTGTYLGDFFVRFLGAPNLALAPAVQDVYLDTMTFIVVSLGVGLIHVNIGHMLMLIRGIREKQKHLVIGRVGLFILQIAGIPWMMHFIGADLLPLAESTYSILLYIMLLSILLIIIASLLEKGAFLGSIFWIFDITGILGDVMSYARLAGVGLATYFLAYCFNLMSELVANMLPAGIIRIVLGTIVMVVILLFGHTLNLVLSSITCFVHSLRLCFVEFLFKFYEGGGRQYSPLRLRKREAIPVRAKA